MKLRGLWPTRIRQASQLLQLGVRQPSQVPQRFTLVPILTGTSATTLALRSLDFLRFSASIGITAPIGFAVFSTGTTRNTVCKVGSSSLHF
ncbi:hypothetical protein CVS40_12891 [Lucilia cuprina]|nr:hypothetical protein CVS40_12891 [Lucilia cuprina]